MLTSVRTEVLLISLSPKTLPAALAENRFLFVFVYGKWCPFAQTHLENFRSLAKNTQVTMLPLARLSIETPLDLQEWLSLEKNPTFALFIDGNVAATFTFDSGKTLEEIHAQASRITAEQTLQIIDASDLSLMTLTDRSALIFSGTRHSPKYFIFLQLVLNKKSEDFDYFLIEKSQQEADIILHRHDDHAFITAPQDLDFGGHLQWIYHHAQAPLLRFPEPALRLIKEHRNVAMIFVLENSNTRAQAETSQLIAELHKGAERLFKSFKTTFCFSDDVDCRTFLYDTLGLQPIKRFPAVRVIAPIEDFRGPFLAFKATDGSALSEAAIEQIADDFFESRLEFDMISQNIPLEHSLVRPLNSLMLYETLMEEADKDVFVLCFRSSLDQQKLLSSDFSGAVSRLSPWDSAVFYTYDVDQNYPFGFKEVEAETPALVVAQKDFLRYQPKLFKTLKDFRDVLLILCDQLLVKRCQEIGELIK